MRDSQNPTVAHVFYGMEAAPAILQEFSRRHFWRQIQPDTPRSLVKNQIFPPLPKPCPNKSSDRGESVPAPDSSSKPAVQPAAATTKASASSIPKISPADSPGKSDLPSKPKVPSPIKSSARNEPALHSSPKSVKSALSNAKPLSPTSSNSDAKPAVASSKFSAAKSSSIPSANVSSLLASAKMTITTMVAESTDIPVHFECFWKNLKNGDQINVSSIKNVDWVEWSLQERLRLKIEKWSWKEMEGKKGDIGDEEEMKQEEKEREENEGDNEGDESEVDEKKDDENMKDEELLASKEELAQKIQEQNRGLVGNLRVFQNMDEDELKKIMERFGQVQEYSHKQMAEWLADASYFGGFERCDNRNCTGVLVYDADKRMYDQEGRLHYDKKEPICQPNEFSIKIVQKYLKKNQLEDFKTDLFVNGVVSRARKFRDYHVLVSEDGSSFTATLVLAYPTIGKNEYQIIQVVKHFRQERFHFIEAIGCIGFMPSTTTTKSGTLTLCTKKFEDTFQSKTGNMWLSRNGFKRRPGQVDYMENLNPSCSKDFSKPRSVYPKEIQDLMKLLLDEESLETCLRDRYVDTKKMPLGEIKLERIQQAEEILKQINEQMELNPDNVGAISGLTCHFYTIIPHVFVDGKIPMIATKEAVEEKVRLLEDMRLIVAGLEQYKKEGAAARNSFDEKYETLDCFLTLLHKGEEDYTRILDYVRNGYGSTHKARYEIVDVFRVQKPGEDESFTKSNGRSRLLWHGSRTSNIAGILAEGLKIAPEDAPSDGAMFGKGVYFADIFSKSAQYCNLKPGEEGAILLCEVFLGKQLALLFGKTMSPERIKKMRADSVAGIGTEYIPEKMTTSTKTATGFHRDPSKKQNTWSSTETLLWTTTKTLSTRKTK